jgi:hypothetical protein
MLRDHAHMKLEKVHVSVRESVGGSLKVGEWRVLGWGGKWYLV